MLLLVAAGGCSRTNEFEEYKAEMAAWRASVQKSGAEVDLWISQAQQVIAWVSVNGGSRFHASLRAAIRRHLHHPFPTPARGSDRA